jgi:hypothetical protein
MLLPRIHSVKPEDGPWTWSDYFRGGGGPPRVRVAPRALGIEIVGTSYHEIRDPDHTTVLHVAVPAADGDGIFCRSPASSSLVWPFYSSRGPARGGMLCA